MGRPKRISHQYGYTNTGCIYSISQSLACRTGLPYSQIKDRDTPYVSFTRKRIEAHICICFVALKVYKELERMLKVSEIKMSVDKVAHPINQGEDSLILQKKYTFVL